MEPVSLRSESDTALVALLLDLGGRLVSRCDERSCEVCGPVLDAAA